MCTPCMWVGVSSRVRKIKAIVRVLYARTVLIDVCVATVDMLVEFTVHCLTLLFMVKCDLRNYLK